MDESETLAPFENSPELGYINDHENSVVSIKFNDQLWFLRIVKSLNGLNL